jgi:YgiT-type zinc finger domain-containing protein
MICLICRKSETIGGFTNIEFARGEFRLIVKGVPARLCPGCGEAYAAEAVAEQLLKFASQRSDEGILDTECEFGSLYI